MVVVSYSGKEINAKLVYYGAGLCGKTTNLESIYEAVPDTSRGKMVSMKTQSDRTLFFDLLPLDLGEIMGFKTRFLLYTVPGQVFYNATRKLVLKGADAIVFVADSEVGKMDENRESLGNLRTNFTEYGVNLDETPWVLQYNKRDLPNVYSVEDMNAALNPDGKTPWFEAVATQGKGVFETFRGISHLLMDKVTRELRRVPHGGGRSSRTVEAGLEALKPDILSPPSRTALQDEAGHVLENEAKAVSSGFARELEMPRGGLSSAGGFGAGGPDAAGDGAPATQQTYVVSDSSALPDGVRSLRPPVGQSDPARTLEIDRSESGGGNELVVPVTLPKGTTREIVLRIVITHPD